MLIRFSKKFAKNRESTENLHKVSKTRSSKLSSYRRSLLHLSRNSLLFDGERILVMG